MSQGVNPCLCVPSPFQPASVCQRALGEGGGGWTAHEADLHLLYEEGGDQRQDTGRLVLPAIKGGENQS